MDIKLTKDQLKKDRARFGGSRLIVYKRDNYSCVDCGMTMHEHQDRYKKMLTINHINGIGRNSQSPDNHLDNLETLCLPCHGVKDATNQKWANSNGNPLNRS